LNEIPNELNECRIEKIQLDFINDKLPFINLDGLLMANSLHYVKDKLSFFSNVNVYLKSRHQLLVVEYDTDRANRWVPFPISFRSLEQVMHESGYKSIIKLSERPSVYGHGNIYSAAIFKN
jgi:hypothetical protein